MKISGCIITRNEEENIAKCINSLSSVTDEIIVLDTGSEDRTIQIATELGAAVYEYKWVNDFSKAKNAALDYAKGDWIIFLDADEYFREDSLPKVRLAIESVHPNKNAEGILCEILNVDTDTGRIISSNEVLRIFRNKKEIRYINSIHEEIRSKGEVLKCITFRHEISIVHTGYSSSLQISKARRNLEYMLSNAENEKNAYYLANTYFTLQDYDNAYKYAETALSLKAVTEWDYLAYKMYLIKIRVTMIIESMNKAKIQNLINEANQKYGNHPEIVRIEANYLLGERHYEKALEKYMHALHCNKEYGKSFGQNDFAAVIHDVYCCVGQIYYQMNNEADALSYFVKALQSNKYNKDAFNNMLVLCRTIPETETIAFINSIYNMESEADVEFIISQAANCGRPKIVLYYARQWNNTFEHEDDVLIYAFLSQENFKNAFEIAALYMKADKEKYLPIVSAVLILGRLFTEAEDMKTDIGSDCYEIIKCYSEKKKYTGSAGSYLSVLSILAKYINQHQFDFDTYLEIGSAFGETATWNMAELFLNEYRFELAGTYYKIFFELQTNGDMKAAAAFGVGYSFYKLKHFQNSVYWFEQAILNGYTENDIAEYLRWITSQTSDTEIKHKTEGLLSSYYALLETNNKKLHIGCGRDIRKGWINLDFVSLPGVDVVANLDACQTTPLPFEDDTIDEILANHVIEHINNPLPMMQELYRIAKPNAKALFRCPYGTSDDAFEDPTHVKQYFLHSFGYFSQPFYWRADYGYRGDWFTDKIILVVERKKYEGMNVREIMDAVLKYRNTVIEMIVELHAEKPMREPKRELIVEPEIEIRYV